MVAVIALSRYEVNAISVRLGKVVPQSLVKNCYTVPVTQWKHLCIEGQHCASVETVTHTHTHPFNGPLSGTIRVSQYQKGKINLDFTEARDSEWQWQQLGHVQVCTSLQTDNHTSTPPLSFYRPDALPAAQPTASKH